MDIIKAASINELLNIFYEHINITLGHGGPVNCL